MNPPESAARLGLAGRLAATFLHAKLTPLIVIGSVLLGAFATLLLPREEEPQIQVPMVDVMVRAPGFNVQEVEARVTRPMEKLLWEIAGVDYVYSISRPGESLVIVRFAVGEDAPRSLVKLNQKLQSHAHQIPPGVSAPQVVARAIDDVPILALTLHSAHYDHQMLRRLAAELEDRLKAVPAVAQTSLIGGARRQVRVLLDPAKLAAHNLSAARVLAALKRGNVASRLGSITAANQSTAIESDAFFADADAVRAVVVGGAADSPVRLNALAQVQDGAEEMTQYVLHGQGAHAAQAGGEQPAVTLTVAKRPGANAISVAETVLAQVEAAKGEIIPRDVQLTITRHYGHTAQEKANELLLHMGIAVLSVSLLILLALGWREAGVVAVAIPTTLALTLLVFFLYGFTLNRITLFALIFSIGILVDDAIVVVENMVRHLRLPENRGKRAAAIAIRAVSEVGNPTILATFTVIAAVLPMAFVGGLMGPYMRPIPIGASAAMFFSLAIAFIVTPWAALRLLRPPTRAAAATQPSATVDCHRAAPPPPSTDLGPADGHGHDREDWLTRRYRLWMGPLIARPRWRWSFLIGITLLLGGAIAMVGLGWVRVKMLPFDNKSEFQVILNMPEGSSLEHTTAVAQEMAAHIRRAPEVRDYQIYAGTAAPFNFNGLVRHYFLRRGDNVADIQVNLKDKQARPAQSHSIVKRLRPAVARVARRHGGHVALAEVPPGPPVLQTLVAEVYGPDAESRRRLAAKVETLLRHTPGVVDVDTYREAPQPRARLRIDRDKAALHGIDVATIDQSLRLATRGLTAGLVHVPGDREAVPLRLELPRAERSHIDDLLRLRLPARASTGAPAPLVPLSEVVDVQHDVIDASRYHKNLMPVEYVLGDVAGAIESPAYAIFAITEALERLDRRTIDGGTGQVQVRHATRALRAAAPTVKWDGEWQITLEVFRDLGLAFGAVLLLIYMLMVGWFRSFLTPIIVMAAIPFSLVGILPAHAALGAFFTATSMIGFMAGAGIVVRNSIILVDFIELRLRQGMPLHEAVIDAGAVRFRPMMLTAMAVVVGAAVILADPIFQGLALALMAGEIASLFISRMAVPVLYFMAYRK